MLEYCFFYKNEMPSYNGSLTTLFRSDACC